MRREALGLVWVCALLTGIVAGLAHAQNAPPPRRDPCRDVHCGHGRCVSEMEDAFCFCEEGYAASGLACRAVQPARALVSQPSSIGLSIVQVAIAEDGRDLAHVGEGRSLPPGPLARYVRAGGLWCSDFVSWVYRAAGVPFTGGYEGGWMLPNNAAIRGWFERRGTWVGRTERGYGSFQPRPGDYVRISTPTWNHSAIVRYAEGSTLYAVEGNAGGHVRLTRYTRWREDVRLEGFGLVSLAVPRVEALRRAPP